VGPGSKTFRMTPIEYGIHLLESGKTPKETIKDLIEIYASGAGTLTGKMVKCHRDGCNRMLHLGDASWRIGAHNYCPEHARKHKGELEKVRRVDLLRAKDGTTWPLSNPEQLLF